MGEYYGATGATIRISREGVPRGGEGELAESEKAREGGGERGGSSGKTKDQRARHAFRVRLIKYLLQTTKGGGEGGVSRKS